MEFSVNSIGSISVVILINLILLFAGKLHVHQSEGVKKIV